MNVQNLLTLAVLFTFAILALQRTERKRIWLTALILILPSGYLIYRWAKYRGQIDEALAALGIAAALNILFWIVYGRKHPPRSSDEIHVVGMDD